MAVTTAKVAVARDEVPAGSRGWKPWLYAVLSALLVLAGEQTIESAEQESLLQHERATVIGELAQIRSRLESVINGNLLAIHGLTSVIAAQPDITQQEFARIARGLVTEQRPLRNIAGAPGMVVSLMYPMEGNEAAIGLDYRTNPEQRDAALKALESGEPLVAGPVQLIQGGTALIVRAPVFILPSSPGQERQVWGLVSAVLNVETLYRLAGLVANGGDTRLKLALRGTDGKGAEGAVFFGDPDVFERDPSTIMVSLPGGSWQLAALPAGGWGHHRHDDKLLLIRLSGLLLAITLATLAYQLSRRNEELQRTTARLRDSQALFEGFMDQLPAGAFIDDPIRHKTLFENRWLQENLPGRQDEHPINAAGDLEALRSGPQLIHHRRHGPGGKALICDTLRFVLPETGGSPLIGGIVMDVTDRTLAEHELAANRARLRSLLNTLPDLVWLKDPEGVYLACNPRFEDFFGATEADILGRRDQDFVGSELAEAFRENDMATIAAGKATITEETRTFANDGHQELLETIQSPVLGPNGELIGVLGISRDMTARRQVEDKLRDSKQRLEAAERIARLGNWEYRVADGRIRWSDEAYRIFGLSPQERQIDYEWLRSCIHPDDRDMHDDYLRGMLEARPGQEIPEFRYRIVPEAGGERVLSVSVHIAFGRDNTPIRLFGTLRDITESEQLQHDLEARLDELTRWQGVMLGREDRIRELKEEVNHLLGELGRASRYGGLTEDT